MVLSPENGPVSISTRFDVQGETLYQFSVSAGRYFDAAPDSSGRPWATIGINFYDELGNQLGQKRMDVRSDSIETQQIEFIAPPEATNSYVWAWIGEGPNVPLVVSEVQLDEVDLTDDSTPVAVELREFSLTEPTGAELNFAVDFTDDQRRGTVIAQPFRVTGPNSFNELAGVRTGLPDSTQTFQTLIYGLLKADGSDWAPSDNGIYTVELLDNAVVDAAGNVTPGGVIGELEIAIVLPPQDREAPEISIGPISNLTQPQESAIEFAVYTTDNRSPFPFARNITVARGDGTPVTNRGIAGGFDASNNRNWELRQIFAPGGNWGPEDNGTYFIRLESGGLIDAAGNEAPSQLLGSFDVNIGGIDVG